MGEMFKNHNSGFLFARPSFIEGMARIFDFGGTLNTYNDSPNGAVADKRALSEDWKSVGNTLRTALAEYRSSIE